jgi:hypothetical protein
LARDITLQGEYRISRTILMENFQSLSLRQCLNLNPELVEMLNETIWHIPQVSLPLPFMFMPRNPGVPIEVDQAYLVA